MWRYRKAVLYESEESDDQMQGEHPSCKKKVPKPVSATGNKFALPVPPPPVLRISGVSSEIAQRNMGRVSTAPHGSSVSVHCPTNIRSRTPLHERQSSVPAAHSSYSPLSSSEHLHGLVSAQPKTVFGETSRDMINLSSSILSEVDCESPGLDLASYLDLPSFQLNAEEASDINNHDQMSSPSDRRSPTNTSQACSFICNESPELIVESHCMTKSAVPSASSTSALPSTPSDPTGRRSNSTPRRQCALQSAVPSASSTTALPSTPADPTGRRGNSTPRRNCIIPSTLTSASFTLLPSTPTGRSHSSRQSLQAPLHSSARSGMSGRMYI